MVLNSLCIEKHLTIGSAAVSYTET